MTTPIVVAKTFTRGLPRRAFSMIEIMVTVAIIGILTALLLPNLSKKLNSVKAVQCTSNLRQIGMGLLRYATDNNGQLPQGSSWDKDIAPYFDIPTDSSGTPTAPSKVFTCPMDPKPLGQWQRSYAASRMQTDPTDSRGVFGRSSTQASRRLASIKYPGLTIMICEKFEATSRQFSGAFSQIDGNTGNSFPADWRLADGSYYHRTGQNYLFCDGHVESLKDAQVSKAVPVTGWRHGLWSIGPD